MQQLLNQPHRAQPAADGAAQRQPKKQQNAQHIPGRAAARGRQRVLKCAQWARADSAGAGIAVKPRYAQILDGAGIDIPLNKALGVGIVQQRGVYLNQPPLGGAVRRPPGAEPLTQGRCTPCRY